MPNVMAALPNIGAPSLQRRKIWLTPTTGALCSNAAKIGSARLGRKVNVAPGKIPLLGKNTRKCIYSVPAQGRPNIVQSLVGFR